MEKQQQLKNGKVYETLHEEAATAEVDELEADTTSEDDTKEVMEE